MSKKVNKALEAAGAVLVRDHKHYVYRLPNNRQVTISKSASDHRAEMNILKDISRTAVLPPLGATL